jgi:alkylation response protein AidB-like acyl-CoA dehydrogenase
MDFSLTEERQALVDMLGRLLRDRYSIDLRRQAAQTTPGHDPATWKHLSELGVLGALFAPEQGGFGGSAFDLIAVFEALGRALVNEPVLPALMAGSILVEVAPQEAAAVMGGERIIAFAHFEPQSRYDIDDIATTARTDGEGWRLHGAKGVVLHAEAADALLLSARPMDAPDELALFLVPADTQGLTLRGYQTIDGQRAAEVELDGAVLDPEALVARGVTGLELVERAVARGTLALCAESIGTMEWLKEATLEYLRTRVQFGAPIGSNQALQHRMAEVLIEVEQARSAVINAAAALDNAEPTARDRALSAAKYTIGTIGTHVAEEAIQLHGGMGMTQELEVSHYAKRAIMIDHQLGDADHHLGRYMAMAAAPLQASMHSLSDPRLAGVARNAG